MGPTVVEKAIIEVLNKGNFGVKMPANFPPGEDLFAQGVIDSFGIIHFVVALQKRFDIKIKDRDVHPGNFETIEKITVFICTKMQERKE